MEHETDFLTELLTVADSCDCDHHSEPAAKPAVKVQRHCYRCSECLAVFFVDGKRIDVACACGGQAQHLGRVQAESLWHDKVECACDSRCTGARGPSCNCKCGGENHGTDAVVEVVVHAGKCRDGWAAMNAPNSEKLAEYRAAYETAKARFVARYGTDPRAWLPYEEYRQRETDRTNLHRAHGLQTHRARMRVLASVAA
jgi:hypothetical protein